MQRLISSPRSQLIFNSESSDHDDLRRTLESYLGSPRSYMTDSWLRNYFERAKDLNVDIGNKDEALAFLRDVRRSERQQQQRVELTRSSIVQRSDGTGRNGGKPLQRRSINRPPLPPARADTIDGLRRMFKEHRIFERASDQRLSEFIEFIEIKGGDVHAGAPILRLYGLFLTQNSQAPRQFVDNPETQMVDRLIDATKKYLGPSNTPAEAAARYAEELKEIFRLDPFDSRLDQPVRGNALTELIRQTPNANKEMIRELAVHICTTASQDVLNELDQFGETPLTTAIHHDSLDFVELLSEFGADVNCANARGDTPLTLALLKHPHLAQPLLNEGADVFYLDRRGDSPLKIWLQKGRDPEMGLALLANTCEQTISSINQQGGSLFHAQSEFTETVKALSILAESGSELGNAAADCLKRVKETAANSLNPLDYLLIFVRSPRDAYLDSVADSVPAFVRRSVKKLHDVEQIITVLEQTVIKLDALFRANDFPTEKNPANVLTRMLCTMWKFEDYAYGLEFISNRGNVSCSYNPHRNEYTAILMRHVINQLMRHPELISANLNSFGKFYILYMNDDEKCKFSFHLFRTSPETAFSLDPILLVWNSARQDSFLTSYIADTIKELLDHRRKGHTQKVSELLLNIVSVASRMTSSELSATKGVVVPFFATLPKKEMKELLRVATERQRKGFEAIRKLSRQGDA